MICCSTLITLVKIISPFFRSYFYCLLFHRVVIIFSYDVYYAGCCCDVVVIFLRVWMLFFFNVCIVVEKFTFDGVFKLVLLLNGVVFLCRQNINTNTNHCCKLHRTLCLMLKRLKKT